MLAHQEDLAILMTAEQGKPLAESKGEIALRRFVHRMVRGRSASACTATSFPGIKRQADSRAAPAGRRGRGHHALELSGRDDYAQGRTRARGRMHPGLQAGDPDALFGAGAGGARARAGIPQGVFNVITGSAAAIGGEMTSNPTVRKLTFTGSTEIGKKLMAQCAATVKKISLELGGNAPFIVFDDADLDAAVQGAIASKYRNTGQTCVCANRLLVQAGVYDEFAKKLAEAVGKLRVGDGLAGVTDQGPLIDAKAVAKIEEHIADAVAKGATIALGGKRHALGGTFFEPTILTQVTPAMLVAREETFGPVAPLFKFKTEAEAIAMANDTEFGLAAYLYTRDLARSWRVSEAIEYGIVGLNTGIISTEVAPFGGVKESGIGREGSKYGILDYTEMKYVCVGGVS